MIKNVKPFLAQGPGKLRERADGARGQPAGHCNKGLALTPRHGQAFSQRTFHSYAAFTAGDHSLRSFTRLTSEIASDFYGGAQTVPPWCTCPQRTWLSREDCGLHHWTPWPPAVSSLLKPGFLLRLRFPIRPFTFPQMEPISPMPFTKPVIPPPGSRSAASMASPLEPRAGY